jgi:hypothetical protein
MNKTAEEPPFNVHQFKLFPHLKFNFTAPKSLI